MDSETASQSTQRRRRWPWIVGGLALAGGATAFFAGTGSVEDVKAAPGQPVPEVRDDGIWLPPSFQKMAGLQSEAAKQERVAPPLEVIGNVALNPEYVSAIGTRARGLVREVLNFEGDTVKSGDLLASIESSELAEAEAGIAAAAAQVDAAEQNFRRERKLHEDGLTTQREVEEARATLTARKAELAASRQRMAALVSKGGADRNLPLGHYTLRAPIGGTIIERTVHQGQSVEETEVAFRVADLTHLWVELRIPERHLSHIQRGDTVHIAPLGVSDQQVQATVAYVGDLIDPGTGTGTVRVDVDNSKRLLRPGQTVVASIVPRSGERDTLTVAESSITWIDGVSVVFVNKGNDIVSARPVKLGARLGARHEVTSGLTAGEQVITSGVFAIKSELYR